MRFIRIGFPSLQQFFVNALIAVSLLVTGVAHAEGGPATVADAERIVKLAAAADKDPLATMSSAEGRWFEKWADDVSDYMFGPDKGVFWFHNGVAKGDLMRVLRFHHSNLYDTLSQNDYWLDCSNHQFLHPILKWLAPMQYLLELRGFSYFF